MYNTTPSRFVRLFITFVLTLVAARANAQSVNLAWDPDSGSNIAGYVVYVGTAPGIYSGSTGVGNVTTWTVGGLTAGQTYYFAVKAIDTSGLQSAYSNEVSSTVASSTAPADLTTPAPGSTLTSSTVQFQWTAGSGVSGYLLSLGTTVGGADLFSLNAGTSQSATVTGLPTNGSTIYARLTSTINGVAQYHDYTYTAMTAVPAQLTTPAPGSTLPGTSVQFSWNAGTGVSGYTLAVGTTLGGSNIASVNAGTSLSASVSGLPSNGSTVYVRLGSLIGTAWQYRDYTYTSTLVLTPAQLTTPAPGSTLTGSSAQFGWTAATSATQYGLYVGSSSGASDLANVNAGTNLSASVSGLPTDGRTLYVQLRWLVNSTWQSANYSYKAYTATTTATCPCSIWGNSAAGSMDTEAAALELGVKFRSDVNGYVTGVRFYKYSQNSGTHVGHLWTAGGQLLATVTFSNETASGWQQAMFSTPVAISANTTYVISYHTNVGFYASTTLGLANKVDNAPLHAPANTSTSGNGVYHYGSTSGFPNQSWYASNYWVDVVFKQ